MTGRRVGRRQFLTLAGTTAGTALVAGCSGGGGDGDGSTPSTRDGTATSGGTTASGGGTTRTATAPATGSPCDQLLRSGYTRYDGAGKPIQFTFEYPSGWDLASETPLGNGMGLVFRRGVRIGDESFRYGLSVINGNKPIENPDLDAFVEAGWTDFPLDFGGTPARFVIAPADGSVPGRSALGYLPHDGPDGRTTFHSSQFSFLGDDDAPCDDGIDAMLVHALESVTPNAAGTFEPAPE